MKLILRGVEHIANADVSDRICGGVNIGAVAVLWRPMVQWYTGGRARGAGGGIGYLLASKVTNIGFCYTRI